MNTTTNQDQEMGSRISQKLGVSKIIYRQCTMVVVLKFSSSCISDSKEA